jgi:hypothetical protein
MTAGDALSHPPGTRVGQSTRALELTLSAMPNQFVGPHSDRQGDSLVEVRLFDPLDEALAEATAHLVTAYGLLERAEGFPLPLGADVPLDMAIRHLCVVLIAMNDCRNPFSTHEARSTPDLGLTVMRPTESTIGGFDVDHA